VALALARARIMGARYPFYLLADSREGQLKEGNILISVHTENSGELTLANDIFTRAGAQDICSSQEATTPDNHPAKKGDECCTPGDPCSTKKSQAHPTESAERSYASL
jgi:hypothetical protein